MAKAPAHQTEVNQTSRRTATPTFFNGIGREPTF
jgi:hypothetical protein